MKHKLFVTLTLLVVSLGLSAAINAQGLFKGVDWVKAVEAAKNGNTQVDKEVISRVEAAYAESESTEKENLLCGGRITGTWYMTVPGATPAETFYAYHTFGTEGTFVETSSLLVTLTEGPAHGVWTSRGCGTIFTFELFAFDPEAGVQVGRVRVRNAARFTDMNNLAIDSAVDFIELDGTIIPNIAAGPYTGERVQLRGL